MHVGVEAFWDPNEWESFVFGLVQDRHGALNVQKVPARHRGDHGLDYYCLRDRVVYQCYAVQEPSDVSARAANQKIKVTNDLKKFCSNSAPLKTLFQNARVLHWVLVVPLHDSSTVNQHLANKTTEVRGLDLGYVDPEFEALIQDLDAFPVYSKEARRKYAAELSVATRPPSLLEVETWTESQNELVQNLLRKLAKRVGVTPTILADTVIGWFLEWENILEDLRDDAPQLHETVKQVVKRKTRRLEFAGPPSGAAEQVLRGAIEDLVGALREEVPNLSVATADAMALGVVADWLLRCPLDYPPYENAS